jgi:hypothetical protein
LLLKKKLPIIKNVPCGNEYFYKFNSLTPPGKARTRSAPVEETLKVSKAAYKKTL